MKVPRDWNGIELARSLSKLSFQEVRQSGSHIMLRHIVSGEVISVPAHRPLHIGTLNRLLNDVAELSGLTKAEVIEKLR